MINERAVHHRLPPPRSKSPIKTFLQSPARRNPSHPPSSPTRAIATAARASQTSSVRRKLDFGNESGNDSFDGEITGSSRSNGSLHKKGKGFPKTVTAKMTSVPQIRPYVAEEDDAIIETDEDSYQFIEGGNDDVEMNEEPEEESEPELKPVPKAQNPKLSKAKENARLHDGDATGRKRGRPRRTSPVLQEDNETSSDVGEEEDEEEDEEEEEEVEKSPVMRRGRKPKESTPPAEVDDEAVEDVSPEIIKEAPKKRGKKRKEADAGEDQQPTKKTRLSLDTPVPEPLPAVKPKKPAKKASEDVPAPKAAKPKPGPKKQKLVPIAEAESPEVHRGPPLPRNNNGLFIYRRDTPNDGVGFKTTRSGRNSFKPLAFWKGERAEFDEPDAADVVTDGGNRFLVRGIKQVVRADETEDTRPSRSRRNPSKSKGQKGARREPESEEDEAEPWETEPGRIVGDVREWDEVEQAVRHDDAEIEQELALSSDAIITREVGSGATFKFAKTLTLPFFGAGMVDLEPGGVKKPKNSRRMQMVFFVVYGRVEVTVNDTAFRIGKGGMWQVPRGMLHLLIIIPTLIVPGNFYSISNDYDKPARIFFSQGCDLEGRDGSQ